MHPAVTNGSYDIARIRQDFPALAMQVYGKPLVYLDNAASAQKPQAVLDRLNQAYTSEYANVHRGLHYLANAATEAYEGAREKVRVFLNAKRAEEIVRMAHERGIPVVVDGSQAAVHLDVDVQDIGCDFYAITGHKLYGPTGIGALYGKYEHLASMRPFNGGGEMIKEVFQDRVIYGEPPHKFEAGTPPILQPIGPGPDH